MHRILLFFLLLGSFSVCAQRSNPILSSEDTTAMNNAMNMDADAIDMQDAAMKDSLSKAGYALRRLKDVIDMKAKTLWSTSLSQSIRAFQDTTYVLVSPLMKINGKGILIGLVSKLGEINLFDPIDPYVNIYWVVKPVTDQQMPFKLELEIDNSESLPDSLFPEIKTAMEQYYVGKTYNEIEACSTDVIQATQLFLNLLKAKIGDTYAPKYMFRVASTIRRPGFTEELLVDQTSTGDDSLVKIAVVNRLSGEVQTNNVAWDESLNERNGFVYINKKITGDHTITATVDDSIDIEMHIKIWDGDIRQPLESLLLSVLDEAIKIVLDTIQSQLIAKSQAKNNAAIMLQSEHERVVTKRGTVQIESGNSALSDNDIVIYDSDMPFALIDAPPIELQPNIGAYKVEAKKYAALLLAIEFIKNNRVALMNLAKPQNRKKLVDSINADLGTMGANILMSLINGGKEEMKSYLVEFLTDKLTASNQ